MKALEIILGKKAGAEDLKKAVEKAPKDAEDVYLNKALKTEDALVLLNHFKELKELRLPPTYYSQTGKEVREALEEAGVKVAVEKKRGRPERTGLKERARELKAKGRTAKEASEELKAPLRTVYYYYKAKKAGLKTLTR